MNDVARKELLRIARDAVRAAVTDEKPSPPEDVDEELTRKCGAFVTLKTAGRLRGCLGHFTSDQPLWKTVQEMATASVLEDPRFLDDRLQPRELPHVEIDISVLSPLRRVNDPLEFELGVHGIYIKRGGQSGCFLPQVATETGWSKEEFLTHCTADKAGLPPDAWRDPETEVHMFDAEIIA